MLRKLFLMILGFASSLYLTQAQAYEAPISIAPTDVVSADVLNDIMRSLELDRASVQPSDLVGSWDLQQYVCLGGTISASNNTLCLGDTALSGATRPTGTYQYRTDVVDVAIDGNFFTFRAQQNNPLFNPVLSYAVPNDIMTWTCDIAGGSILACLGPQNSPTYACGVDQCRLHVFMQIRRIDANSVRISLGPADTASPAAVASAFSTFNTLILTRRDAVPAAPQDMQLVLAQNDVSLSWQAVADSTYEVLRKSAPTDAFAVIGTTANPSYVDSVTADATYWYRVRAINTNGTSTGSNVRKVLVQVQ